MYDVIVQCGRRLALWRRSCLLVALVVLPGCGGSGSEDVSQGLGNLSERTFVVDHVSTVSAAETARKQWLDSLDDPQADGWESEVLHNQAKKSLSKLSEWLAKPNELDTQKLSRLFDKEMLCESLRPAALTTVYEGENFLVRRNVAADTEEVAAVPQTYRGFEGFLESFRHLLVREDFFALQSLPRLNMAFKVYDIDVREEQHFSTKQYVAMSGVVENQTFEIHSEWLIDWITDESHELAKLQRIRVVGPFEETLSQMSATPTLFSECTESILSNNPSFQEQLIWGRNFWRHRMDAQLDTNISGHNGIAVGDVNGDGLEDVYLCQPGGLPNRLFVRNLDGTLTDCSSAAGVDWNDSSRGALLVDLDNDGDQDLVVATRSKPATIIMSNDGSGKFELRHVVPDVTGTMLCAADFDGDALLDLYICAEHADADAPSLRGGVLNAFVDFDHGGKNLLLRNDGDLQFTNVTDEVGMAENHRLSFAASWEDFDDDGDQDLYVANDFGPNHLYRNEAGNFTDVAAELEGEDRNFGMSVSWGDYDRDGRMDVYVSNMFSAAGNRIVPKDDFQPDAAAAERAIFKQFARGNTLLKNASQDGFVDVSTEHRVTMGRWAWGSNFVDINNDGWEDLLVANGNITGDAADDL